MPDEMQVWQVNVSTEEASRQERTGFGGSTNMVSPTGRIPMVNVTKCDCIGHLRVRMVYRLQ